MPVGHPEWARIAHVLGSSANERLSMIQPSTVSAKCLLIGSNEQLRKASVDSSNGDSTTRPTAHVNCPLCYSSAELDPGAQAFSKSFAGSGLRHFRSLRSPIPSEPIGDPSRFQSSRYNFDDLTGPFHDAEP